MRRLTWFALAITLLAPSAAAAQSGEATLRQYGTPTPVPNPSFHGDKTVEYKVLWDVSTAPARPSEMPAGMARPANFLMIADANGIERAKVHLALIISGGAVGSVMTNEAYQAVNGVDNPNIALMKAMSDAGVQIIVCGQAMAGRKISREQVLPFVLVATSATFARATLHAQGYATFAP
ncbi:MAG TPA: DsrE family protein [Gemmatimonadaceae bacterium]|jgi:intracellular sulfur oxidation DsrE/DsrF family protein